MGLHIRKDILQPSPRHRAKIHPTLFIQWILRNEQLCDNITSQNKYESLRDREAGYITSLSGSKRVMKCLL
jgi:hypothetical protein